MLDTIPRLTLAALPTPLEEAQRLARHLGLSRLLVKRDDQTGLAMGGNKARKLEYDFAEIVAGGYDTVITVGGAQSNHARMTAAAARKLGIDVKLVLGGPEVEAFQGNLLLDILFGAEIRYLKNDDSNASLAAAMESWVQELRREGKKPYPLPVGGSTGLGSLGYVRAMRELAGQFGRGPVQILLAVGSCGTLAGTLLGARLYMPEATVIGISISRTSAQIARQTDSLMREAARIMGLPGIPPGEPAQTHDTYFHEYGAWTDSAMEAILTTARLEGLLLDPIYTGKAMAGLMGLARTSLLRRDLPTIFIHTGGLPILFPFEQKFRSLACCTTP
jgi:D-cysteine desulfhydrase